MSDAVATIRSFLKHRVAVTVYSALIIVCIAAVAYFSVRINPSDIQVSTHYTSFGGVNFYTSAWWSAFAFVAFFVAIAVGNTAVGVKLFTRKGAPAAIAFGFFSLGVVFFSCVTVAHVINVAFPL